MSLLASPTCILPASPDGGSVARGTCSAILGRVVARSRAPAPAPNPAFDVDRAVAKVELAVEPYPKAALFALFELGHTSLFEQIVACLISIRTRDETTLVLAGRLFERARTPDQMLRLGVGEIDRLIGQSSFHAAKAAQIHAIAARSVEQHAGDLPCDVEVLTSLAGVGPKCANLALGIACGQTRIGVDVHVHRVTNRWGYVAERTPERTMAALEQRLPRRYWLDINRLLVPFGKHVCTGVAPKCPTCPLLPQCQRLFDLADRPAISGQAPRPS
jgi:endonuclease III